MRLVLVVFLFLIFGVGCTTTPTIYYWGSYENLLYKSYAEPGEAEPNLQIQALTTDIQRAQDEGKPVPPGVHAHLGMLYAAVDNVEQAHAAFVQEKTLYPESATFVDGIIARAFKGESE